MAVKTANVLARVEPDIKEKETMANWFGYCSEHYFYPFGCWGKCQ